MKYLPLLLFVINSFLFAQEFNSHRVTPEFIHEHSEAYLQKVRAEGSDILRVNEFITKAFRFEGKQVIEFINVLSQIKD